MFRTYTFWVFCTPLTISRRNRLGAAGHVWGNVGMPSVGQKLTFWEEAACRSSRKGLGRLPRSQKHDVVGIPLVYTWL